MTNIFLVCEIGRAKHMAVVICLARPISHTRKILVLY